MTDSEQPLVIDNGSGFMKVGFSNDSPTPVSIFPSVIGIPEKNTSKVDCFIGEEALSKKDLLKLSRPIQDGYITNFDKMEKLWHHCFYNELKVAPEEHPLFVAESTAISKFEREKTTQIMLETFNIPAYYVTPQPLLSLFASGRITGVVLETGYGTTNSVAVYESYRLTHATHNLQNLAGNDLTKFLLQLLQDSGYSSLNSENLETVDKIKEKFCYVSQDYAKEIKKDSKEIEEIFELPDGKFITIGNERFKSTEALFQPKLLGSNVDGIHDALFYSVTQCDVDIRKELYNNIIISGGNSMFEGMKERLNQEIQKLTPSKISVKVYASDDRKYGAWTGAALMCSLKSFNAHWMTKQEYDDAGPAIIHQKCI